MQVRRLFTHKRKKRVGRNWLLRSMAPAWRPPGAHPNEISSRPAALVAPRHRPAPHRRPPPPPPPPRSFRTSVQRQQQSHLLEASVTGLERGNLHRSPPRLGVSGGSDAHMVRNALVQGSVRGGGRLYIDSPVQGYTQAEMVRAARTRLAHNRQRAALRQMCQIFDDHRKGLAGVIDANQFERTVEATGLMPQPPPGNHVAQRDARGRAVKVAWRDFVDNEIPWPSASPPAQPQLGYRAPRPSFRQ